MLVRLLVVMDQKILYRLLHDIFYIAPEIITRLITEFATRVAQLVSLVEGTAYLSEAPA